MREATNGFQHRFTVISLVALLMTLGVFYPYQAKAGILSEFRSFLNKAEAATSAGTNKTVQSMPLPKPAMNINPSSKGGGDVIIVDDAALLPEEGPAGTIADIEKPKNSQISLYVVREGDTLSGIATMFDVSVNTIIWANDLPRNGSVRVGQTLTILPVTGVKYTVKKGDTLASIAKQFHGDAEEIAQYNGLEHGLTVGGQIIIPDGEVAAPAATPKAKATASVSGGSVSAGYYLRPVAGGTRTQGIHGYNGIDIGAAIGTPILASAAGEVIIAREGGWNGGYGSYVVIRHGNGTQTLYAHASSVIVGVGQEVVQGQVIGYVGNSGKSTGPHLHFEIRGGPRNPF